MAFTSVTIPSAFSDSDAINALLVDATSDPLTDIAAAADGSEDSAARKDHQHPQELKTLAKFWVKYAGDDVTENASYNVASLTHGGTGDNTITIDTDFSSAHWCAALASRTAGVGCDTRVETMATGSLRVLSSDGSSPANTTYECVVGFGDQ